MRRMNRSVKIIPCPRTLHLLSVRAHPEKIERLRTCSLPRKGKSLSSLLSNSFIWVWQNFQVPFSEHSCSDYLVTGIVTVLLLFALPQHFIQGLSKLTAVFGCVQYADWALIFSLTPLVALVLCVEKHIPLQPERNKSFLQVCNCTSQMSVALSNQPAKQILFSYCRTDTKKGMETSQEIMMIWDIWVCD